LKNILVTGGFGFIGGHLIGRLSQDPNNRIHVVDNLSTNPIPVPVLLDELRHPPNLTYDIMTVEEYVSRNKSARFDQIYHLASPVGPAGVLRHAGKMIKSIVDDTYRMMELAIASDGKLVDVSTSEIYGGGREGYCSEDFSKIVPAYTTVRLEYAIGKLAGETAIINTCKVTSLQASIVRPFNIAGPRQSGKGGFVLPRFIALAMGGKPLTVFGDGTQIRAFTFVEDIVDGILRVMETGGRGEAYNLGNPHNKTSILGLAKCVQRLVNPKSDIVFVDPKKIYGPLYEEANDKYPDAQKAMASLGWDPRKDIDFTISVTRDYMKNVSADVLKLLAGDIS
jgi:UDP-glucose 4-epimerase